MPIYEFYCKCCNKKYESYYPWRYSDEVVYTDDPEMEECPTCNNNVEHIPSLCKMEPDDYWNGVYFETTDQYVTSKSKYKKYLKDNKLQVIGDRTDRESLTKIAEQGFKEKDKKAEKELEGVLIDLFKSEEFGIMGTVKERNKKERKLRDMESAHPEDVFEDPVFK